MPISPEQEPKSPIEERPTEIQVPSYLEKGGVSPIQTQFTAKVTDDSGKPLIQPTDDTKVIPIVTLPKTQQELEKVSKGPVTDSMTWFAAFWLRMLKKALHFGWKVLGRGGTENV